MSHVRPSDQSFQDNIDRRINGLPVSPVLKDMLYRNIRSMAPERQLLALENVEGTLVDIAVSRSIVLEDMDEEQAADAGIL